MTNLTHDLILTPILSGIILNLPDAILAVRDLFGV